MNSHQTDFPFFQFLSCVYFLTLFMWLKHKMLNVQTHSRWKSNTYSLLFWNEEINEIFYTEILCVTFGILLAHINCCTRKWETNRACTLHTRTQQTKMFQTCLYRWISPRNMKLLTIQKKKNTKKYTFRVFRYLGQHFVQFGRRKSQHIKISSDEWGTLYYTLITHQLRLSNTTNWNIYYINLYSNLRFFFYSFHVVKCLSTTKGKRVLCVIYTKHWSSVN